MGGGVKRVDAVGWYCGQSQLRERAEKRALRRIAGLGSWMRCCFAGVAGDLLFDGAKKEAKSAFLPAGRESYRSLPAFLYGYGLQGIATMPAAW
ncbi:hypothetical protein RM96_00330 [Cupriavidus sp. IDO]|nr:hypothetical protein RM96_00330 [Cupriavidus sp. IDO]